MSKIKEVVIQRRPAEADHWDPGITCILKGYDSKEEAIRYVMAKAEETAARFHAEQAKKKKMNQAKK